MLHPTAYSSARSSLRLQRRVRLALCRRARRSRRSGIILVVNKSHVRAAIVAALASSTCGCAQTAREVGVTPSPSTVAATPTKESEHLISSSSPIDYSNVPVIDLSQALRQDSNSNLFRLTWFFSAGSFTSSGTALYNRRNKTIKEFVAEGDWERYGKGSQLYTNVTDTMIHRMSRELGDKGSGPFSFSPLTKYGAIQVRVK